MSTTHVRHLAECVYFGSTTATDAATELAESYNVKYLYALSAVNLEVAQVTREQDFLRKSTS